jgi:hypothetical protein
MELVFDQRLGPDPLRGVENENTRLALYYRHVGNIPLAKKHLEMASEVDKDLLATFLICAAYVHGGFGFERDVMQHDKLYKELCEKKYIPAITVFASDLPEENDFDGISRVFVNSSGFEDMWDEMYKSVQPELREEWIKKSKIHVCARMLLARDEDEDEYNEIDQLPLSNQWLANFGDSSYQNKLDMHLKAALQGNFHSKSIMFRRGCDRGDFYGALNFFTTQNELFTFEHYRTTTDPKLLFKMGNLLSKDRFFERAYVQQCRTAIGIYQHINKWCEYACIEWTLCAKRIPGMCKDLRKEIAKLVWATRATDSDCWYDIQGPGNVKKNKI